MMIVYKFALLWVYHYSRLAQTVTAIFTLQLCFINEENNSLAKGENAWLFSPHTNLKVTSE